MMPICFLGMMMVQDDFINCCKIVCYWYSSLMQFLLVRRILFDQNWWCRVGTGSVGSYSMLPIVHCWNYGLLLGPNYTTLVDDNEFMIYSLLVGIFHWWKDIYVVVIMSWVINNAWVACGEVMDNSYMLIDCIRWSY